MANALATRQAPGAPAQSLSIGGLTVTVPPGYQWSLSTGAAMVLLGSAHPDKSITEETLSAYDVILRNFHPELCAAAAVETLARVKWFPKPHEIAWNARMITALVTSAGMYANDKAGYERIQEIRTWELDILPETREFIARAKSDRVIRAELDAMRRAGSRSRQLTTG